MTVRESLPKLITFDGEARSGKGTIVQAVKDCLRDELGYKVMLIDAGQVFRTLVVAATRAGIDLDNPSEIDTFLSNAESATQSVQLVKDVYHMQKAERDALLYTNEVSVNSAKIGARPLSQEFKDELLRKWLRDAAVEGYEIVLLDGRALEETGRMLEAERLCDFRSGLYFVCDPKVGARRTLGFASIPYEDLDEGQRSAVDQLVQQIVTRNDADRNRAVQPIVEPVGATRYDLPQISIPESYNQRFMTVVDTSANMTKHEMSRPICDLVQSVISR